MVFFSSILSAIGLFTPLARISDRYTVLIGEGW